MNNQRVLITAGASGIGREIARLPLWLFFLLQMRVSLFQDEYCPSTTTHIKLLRKTERKKNRWVLS